MAELTWCGRLAVSGPHPDGTCQLVDEDGSTIATGMTLEAAQDLLAAADLLSEEGEPDGIVPVGRSGAVLWGRADSVEVAGRDHMPGWRDHYVYIGPPVQPEEES